ncbi:MAG: RluA family pseudouridine synthase [Clostridia bacterium]|nr:RluA family pseudouridine synthase [Clostridia bacterium]
MPDILYEDNHVIVAVKPPNMLSQADQTGDTDLLSILKEYIRTTYQKPGNVYLGLVHRLDRPVGGLMVFARTSKAAGRLSEQMRTHEMGREYLCIACGEMEDSFTLTDYLRQDPIRNRVVVCEADEKDGKQAILHGRTLSRRDGTSLCALKLETGRKHQIRVQMSHAGAPLWGDNRYGGGIPGQQIALWGYKLSFRHPTTRKLMRFYVMPEGNVWSLYRDLLTVPEDTEEARRPREVRLSPQVIRTFRQYNGRLYVPVDPEEEEENAADAAEEAAEDTLPLL